MCLDTRLDVRDPFRSRLHVKLLCTLTCADPLQVAKKICLGTQVLWFLEVHRETEPHDKVGDDVLGSGTRAFELGKLEVVGVPKKIGSARQRRSTLQNG